MYMNLFVFVQRMSSVYAFFAPSIELLVHHSEINVVMLSAGLASVSSASLKSVQTDLRSALESRPVLLVQSIIRAHFNCHLLSQTTEICEHLLVM